MAVSLQNLVIFASCVKEFTTKKYFKFHEIEKKKSYRTNWTAEKISCLQEGLPLLLLFFKMFAIVKEQVVGWGTWTALEM